MRYAVVDTDNFGGDYPDEKFVGEPHETREAAQAAADQLNGKYRSGWSPRFFKVVELPYELQPGFEP